MTADLGAPRVTAVLLVTVPTIPGQLAAADLREAMQRNGPIPREARVRLVLGRARHVDHSMLPLLADWLRSASDVVVEGQTALAADVRAALMDHWRSGGGAGG